MNLKNLKTNVANLIDDASAMTEAQNAYHFAAAAEAAANAILVLQQVEENERHRPKVEEKTVEAM